MTYDELLMEADKAGLIVKEAPLALNDGLCVGNKIAIRKDIVTSVQKADVLAEELGHHFTTVGNIIEMQNSADEKQERAARLWAYNKQIGLSGIIEAFKAHRSDRFDIAEFLGVSEEFLAEALECYRQIYGTGIMIDNYYVRFEPNLQVLSYLLVN
ncbi:ImmA/IrrE family metallo-endopeptidase [Hungatella hathewayi]|jgi:hypothetical protein|uniref:ImmA/IrrE family metallo-endopeptidase n=1 Tax=Hungatella hathewayi TaxID=154046 RepID=UPI000E52E08C|nr:ImmA/IrrE family metallo-endopeptidase [Hungatella hathewayi]RGY94194.1 ImmA/IrrE family metallo-endopeptidase [Hungatella hathewayi]DAG71943.1 MAG TPA: IrrE protein [Caudoviricetes sp.]